MVDYRVQVDDLLANWCVENEVVYSDMHDEAFVVKVDGVGSIFGTMKITLSTTTSDV